MLHGRSRRPGRSLVAGPQLAARQSRSRAFREIVDSIVDHVTRIAPEEMAAVTVAIAAMPDQPSELHGVARWRVDKATKTVWLFRIPIERLGHHHPGDPWHERMAVESVVIRAIAELIGWDPWRLAPGREPEG